jgi:hypothetical protein
MAIPTGTARTMEVDDVRTALGVGCLDRFEIESTDRGVLRYALGNSESRNPSESKRSKE